MAKHWGATGTRSSLASIDDGDCFPQREHAPNPAPDRTEPVAARGWRDSQAPTAAGGFAHNWLLDALAAEEHRCISPQLDSIGLKQSEVVCETGEMIDSLIFPTNCVLATVYVTPDGDSVQTSLIGYDGAAGVEALLGQGRATHRTVAQTPGRALRMRRSTAEAEFDRDGTFRRVIDWYLQALITQISQNVVCNRLHSVEQQLCRLLLWSDDRTRANGVYMTHEAASAILGVRREAITQAAGLLKRDGAITYSRGNVRLLGRKALLERSCECYEIVETEFRRFFSRLGLQVR
jgi:CRP-like cAMP-binding protein